MTNKTRFWLPSLADVFFLCPFLYLALSSGQNLLNDGDTGYHIRVGEYIIRNFTVPRHDIFSEITPPLPWVAHEWLSEVLMAIVHSFAGLTGIVLFFSFVLGLTYYLLFSAMKSSRANMMVVVGVVLLAVISSSIHWLARPHIFSLLFTVIWYAILNNYQYEGKDRLWLLPFLMLVWVNLHGGFVIGFVLSGIYVAGNLTTVLFSGEQEKHSSKQKCKKLVMITVAALCLSLINPRGYSILLFPFETVSNQFVMNHVVEFLSPNFHGPLPYKYLLLLTIAVISVSKKRLDPIHFILLLLFVYMSLYSARYIPLFAIVVTPILVEQLSSFTNSGGGRAAEFFQERSKRLALADASARGHAWPIVAVPIICIIALTGGIKFKFNDSRMPVAAVNFLKKEPIKGKMFNNDEFGDYLIYAGWPKYKVFFDGRSDMYGEKWGTQYMKISSVQPGWEQVIKKNHITWIFCGAQSALSAVLLENKEWQLIYADKIAHIFVKKIPEYASLLAKYPDVKPFPVTDERLTKRAK
jgi:hypothetical protein